tara:strand:- start:439 stop:651 length:213 start_codon:yes stop_codon:yes gene_type:complete
MRNKWIIKRLKKMLNESKGAVSIDTLYNGCLSLKQSPTRQHIGVILSSMKNVEFVEEGVWRLKDETPTDN